MLDPDPDEMNADPQPCSKQHRSICGYRSGSCNLYQCGPDLDTGFVITREIKILHFFISFTNLSFFILLGLMTYINFLSRYGETKHVQSYYQYRSGTGGGKLMLTQIRNTLIATEILVNFLTNLESRYRINP
jgi:hypothetical protein